MELRELKDWEFGVHKSGVTGIYHYIFNLIHTPTRLFTALIVLNSEHAEAQPQKVLLESVPEYESLEKGVWTGTTSIDDGQFMYHLIILAWQRFTTPLMVKKKNTLNL